MHNASGASQPTALGVKAWCISALLAATIAGGCTGKTVSFSEEIHPMLMDRCGKCHTPGGQGYEKSGFSVASYETIMKGTKFGPVIVPESPASSSLMRMVEHLTDPKLYMPHGEAGLTRDQLDKLRAWIDQGAKNN
jgi:hypothetical protein